MPIIGFIGAVFGSALYGILAGIGFFAIISLQSSSGLTGLEVLVVPLFAIEAVIAGITAALISLWLPRASFARSDSFALLVGCAIVLQAMVSFVPLLLAEIISMHDIVMLSVAMSGPVDWLRVRPNWTWLVTVPATLVICSPWFRWKFDG